MKELDNTLRDVFNSVAANGVTDENAQTLRAIFEDDLLLAALDLVDNKCVLKYTTPWERTFYWIQSTADPSTATHVNFLGEHSMISWSCECPAFVKHMLLEDDILMCKHILATILAEKMKRTVELDANGSDLVQLLEGQIPS